MVEKQPYNDNEYEYDNEYEDEYIKKHTLASVKRKKHSLLHAHPRVLYVFVV